jgi:putative intracellular protease/amidase
MATKRLQGMQVAILATNGFEQAELEGPRKALEEAGATTVLIAPDSGMVQGMNHNDKGDKFTVDQVLADASSVAAWRSCECGFAADESSSASFRAIHASGEQTDRHDMSRAMAAGIVRVDEGAAHHELLHVAG